MRPTVRSPPIVTVSVRFVMGVMSQFLSSRRSCWRARSCADRVALPGMCARKRPFGLLGAGGDGLDGRSDILVELVGGLPDAAGRLMDEVADGGGLGDEQGVAGGDLAR